MRSKFNGTHHTKAEVTQFLHNARLTSVIPCVKAKILVPLHFSHREGDFWLKSRHCYAIVHNYGCCFTLLVCQGRPWIFLLLFPFFIFPCLACACIHTGGNNVYSVFITWSWSRCGLNSVLHDSGKQRSCVRWPSANCCQCHCKAKSIKLRTTLSTNQSAPSPNYCC